jgi:hypothetical protein
MLTMTLHVRDARTSPREDEGLLLYSLAATSNANRGLLAVVAQEIFAGLDVTKPNPACRVSRTRNYNASGGPRLLDAALSAD